MSKLNNQDSKKLVEEKVESSEEEDEPDNQVTDLQKPKDAKKKKKKKTKTAQSAEPKQSAMGKLIQERLKKAEEEQARIKALQEEEERKIREEEERIAAEKRRVEEEKERKRQAKQDKITAQKKAGTYMTKTDKARARKNKERLEQLMRLHGTMIVDGIIVPDPNYVPPQTKSQELSKITESNKELDIEELNMLAGEKQSYEFDGEDGEGEEDEDEITESKDQYRSIITCIMGHVDTGKTKMLDKIRGTNVQDGEAGGITQQIGATFIPKDTLLQKMGLLANKEEFNINVPGLLMIDTPGHEAFANLRSRGSRLCDIAIVNVDLVHGLEQQTLQSISMLKEVGTRFIISLNKIDRLYGWKSTPDRNIREALAEQDENTLGEFNTRLEGIITQIMELGFNAKLYWENDSIEDTINICPTSAITGEGIGDILFNIVDYSQNYLSEQITWEEEIKCVVMESTVTEGFGNTIDVILINGELSVGNRIIVSTTDGPVETIIRNILTPPPNRESRIKSEYIHHKSIKGAIGIKIVANKISKTLAGTPVIPINSSDEKESLIQQAQEAISQSEMIELQSHGLVVHASTLGSLEALLQFLRVECSPPIPVSQVTIGPVLKKDVVKISIINDKLSQEFKTILAFNVEVDEEAVKEAEILGIKIFTAEIIYHLFDQFIKYKEEIITRQREQARPLAVFPCELKILPNCIFNKKGPLVFGVEVINGNLHLGTPLSTPDGTVIGKVIGIQNDHKDVNIGKKGMSVCIKVDNQENPTISYGRHFDHTKPLYSKITRESINVIKEHFKKDITPEDFNLLVNLKRIFRIG